MSSPPPVQLNLNTFSAPRDAEFVRILQQSMPGWRTYSSPEKSFVKRLFDEGDEVSLYMLCGLFSDLRESVEVLGWAIEDADKKGVAWTPLLDRLGDAWSGAEERRLKNPELKETHGDPAKRLESLREWVRKQEGSEALEVLSPLYSAPIRRLILENARDLSVEQIERWGARTEEMKLLTNNDNLSDDTRGVIASWAWDKHSKVHRQFGYEKDPYEELLRAMGGRAEKGFAESFRQRLLSIFRGNPKYYRARQTLLMDQGASSEVLLELAESASSSEEMGNIVMHPNARWEQMRVVLNERQGEFYKIVSQRLLNGFNSKRVPTEQVLEVVSDLSDNSDALIMAVDHPNADARVWRLAVKSPVAVVRVALSNSRGARQDPEVRGVLLRSRSVDVQENLLKEASAEEFERLFPVLLKLDIERAAKFLAKYPLPEGVQLSPEVLMPLLQHTDAEIRMQAMITAGKVLNVTPATTEHSEVAHGLVKSAKESARTRK